MKCVVELSEAEEMTLQQLSINHMHREPSSRTRRMFGNDWGFPRGFQRFSFLVAPSFSAKKRDPGPNGTEFS
ncbi:hypothetical protein [Paraburkholderia sp. UCT2]|uniref:hypothetical protein n=1 Tax=Paraburkholderia sp. UCT2 TaxID=2615208 RepID=UPI00292A52F2|nr:hypothetical protein [Paraburkholderia sp. UCT2]